jgi:DNA-binding response OmpR family regulator
MTTPKIILLIDDDTDVQQLTKIALRSRGYTVETANNGLEGLTKLETVKPDLIILDMNMPKLGGLGFYQKLCNGNERPPHPVLVFTARANLEPLFKQMKVDGFISKPFEIEDLLSQVDTIIGKKGESNDQ